MSLKIQIGRENEELRKANLALTKSLGSAITLIAGLLHCDSWEEFQEKRDQTKAILDPKIKEMFGEGYGKELSSSG